MSSRLPPASASNATPQPVGSATSGTASTFARADHVHAGPAGLAPSDANPQAPGTAAPGASVLYSRADHAHPAQTIPSASATTPLVASGAGAVGVGTAFARNDHVHPAQTVPVASSATPQPLGSATAGASPDFSRADHVHASPTVPVAGSATPLALGTAAAGSAPAFSREDHVHPAISFAAPVSRTLSMATAYQASTPGKSALVTINLTSTASISLSGGATNTADIVIGSTNAVASGTGTAVGKYVNSNTGTLTIGLNLSTIAGNPIMIALPPNWYFAIRQTAGTVAITSAFDQVVG